MNRRDFLKASAAATAATAAATRAGSPVTAYAAGDRASPGTRPPAASAAPAAT